MRTALFTLLMISGPALACGPYMPMPQTEAGPVVQLHLADGSTLTTTERPGELALEWVDGTQSTLHTFLWDVERLELVDGQLVVTGTEYGFPAAVSQAIDTLHDAEAFFVSVPVSPIG